MDYRGAGGICVCTDVCRYGSRAYAPNRFVHLFHAASEENDPPEVHPEASPFEPHASAGGAESRSDQRDSIGAGTRRLLQGRAERQMGFGHRSGDAEVSVGQWARLHRQTRCAHAAKAGPGFGYRGGFGAQARRAEVLFDVTECHDSADGQGQHAPAEQCCGFDSGTGSRAFDDGGRSRKRFRERRRPKNSATLGWFAASTLNRVLTCVSPRLIECPATCPPVGYLR